MDSNRFDSKTVLTLRELDFHIVNFDEAWLHISIKLDNRFIFVTVVELKRFRVLTGCHEIKALLTFISPLYLVDILPI